MSDLEGRGLGSKDVEKGRPATGRGITIEETKGNQPKVEASKSDKLLRSYGHLKVYIVSYQCRCP